MSEEYLGNLKDMVRPNHYLKTEYSTYWTQWLLANSVLRDGIWYINETPPRAKSYNETTIDPSVTANYMSGSYIYRFGFYLQYPVDRPYTISSPYDTYNMETNQGIIGVSMRISSSSNVITLTIPEYWDGNNYWTGLIVTFRVTTVGSDGITILSEEQI